MKWRNSLGTKLTLAFSILGLGPLIIMGALAVMFVSSTHKQNLAAQEMQLLRQKVSQINKFVETAAGPLDLRIGYAQLIEPLPEQQSFILKNLLDSNKDLMEASFIYAIPPRGVNPPAVLDCFGGQTAQDKALGQEICRYSKNQDASFVGLDNISRLPKFTVPSKGQKYFSPVYYTLAGPMMAISAPVYNSNNEIIMVLTGEFSLGTLAQTISSARLGTQGYVYLADWDGNVFAGADGALYKNVKNSDWVKELLVGISHDGLAKSDIRTGISGVQVLSSGLSLPKFGWALAAEWPTDDAFAIVKTIQGQVVGFSIIAVLIVSFFAWLVGRRVLNPLFILKQGAKKIGSGDFTHKINIDTKDEIEELGQVFNMMGENLNRLEELKAAQIRTEALAESLKKELELSRMREEFLKNTSHQLRTPMSIVNWNFDLVAGAKADAERKEYLSELDIGLKQLNAIIQDLMVMAEYGVGFKNTIYKDINFAEALKKVIDSRKDNLSAKKLVLEQNLSPDIPVLTGHPYAFPIVLENLLDNAITYTPAKGKITLSAVREGNDLHLTLADTGIGIMEKDKSSIFTQFFRGENAISMKNVGTGLGLLICKNIIEGHGGKIWFESKENQGSKFHVLLPMGQVKAEPVVAK